PAVFWTFQEFASAPGVWSVEMARIEVGVPPTTPAPNVSLSITQPSFGEDFGTTTVTAALSTTYADNVEVTLNFSGSAVPNQQYSASSQVIVIPAGQLQGSITLTGLPVAAFGNPNVIVSIDSNSVFNAVPIAPTSVSATIDELDT